MHAQKIEYEGKPAIQGIVLDITQRIEALKALEESELKFRTIFENSGIGMTIISPKGNFIKVNKSFADLFGYTCKEFDGITFKKSPAWCICCYPSNTVKCGYTAYAIDILDWYNERRTCGRQSLTEKQAQNIGFEI